MADSILAFAPREPGSQAPHYLAQLDAGPAAVQSLLQQRCDRLAETLDLSDRGVRTKLLRRLEGARSLRLTWLLLALLERGRSYASEGAVRLDACARLAEAQQPLMRYAAYRWLAQLHTVDLRCENSAKRLLAAATDREGGLAARRIQQLLRLC